MQEEVKNAVASRLGVGITALDRLVERFFWIVGDDMKSIDARV